MTNEIDKFFSELPSEDKKIADIFEDKKPAEQAPASKPEDQAVKAPEEGEAEVRKNRRHRRLEEALQRERESNIALNARIQALSEVGQFSKEFESPADMPAEWVALYGNTPESQAAWKMQNSLFEKAADKARQQALEEFESRQQAVQEEQKSYESFIDSQLENLEDAYNIDLTSDAPKARKTRREFLEMVQNLSPKDGDGTITDYADFGSTFELYQKTNQEKPDDSLNRKKEIAARGVQRSSAVDNTQVNDDATRSYLKSIGIRGI